MLSMARALATDPALLLLDELSMGLAPLIVEELYELVGQIAAEGVVDPHRRAVRARGPRVADVAAIMLHGRVVQMGTPDEMQAALSGAYLGGS